MSGDEELRSNGAMHSKTSDEGGGVSALVNGITTMQLDTPVAVSQDKGLANFSDAAQEVLKTFKTWSEGMRTNFLHELVDRMTSDDHVCLTNLLTPLLRRDLLALLPEEICWKIFFYLDVRTICMASQVNRAWHRTLSNTYFWKKLHLMMRDTNADWELLTQQRSRLLRTDDPGFPWKYMYLSFDQDLKRVARNWKHPKEDPTHSFSCGGNGIYCLQYDNDKIITGSRDHKIKIWDVETYELQREFVGHQGSVLCLQFDETKVISGSSDATVRIWDLETGDCMQQLTSHDGSVLHLKFHRNKLVTCSKDKLVILWELDEETGQYEARHTFADHKAAVNVVEFDEKYIVSASGDRSIRIWLTETGEPHRVLRGHLRGIACLQFKGDTIVTGSSDKTLKKWSIEQGTCLATLRGHDDLVRCVRFNSTHIVSGSYDTTVRIWDFESGDLLSTLYGHRNRVFRVQFDRFKIVSSSQDDNIMVWDFYEHGKKNNALQERFMEPDRAATGLEAHMNQLAIAGGRHDRNDED